MALMLSACTPFPHYDSCLFGGATLEKEAYCAEQSFGKAGTESILRSINLRLIKTDTGNCLEHYARVVANLTPYGYKIEPLATPEHLSALVTDDRGQQFVVDNGYLLDPLTTGGVETLVEFRKHHPVQYTWLDFK